MKTETKFVIDYFTQHKDFYAMKILTDYNKIVFMKSRLDLKTDTELTQVQCNLFYAAKNNVEWDVVLKSIESENCDSYYSLYGAEPGEDI